MTNVETDQLYRLLPAVYRLRDAERGEPLKALLAVLAEQAGLVEADIARLYENWFIETCDEWLVPYIGELLGVRGLLPSAKASEADISQRPLVANTLRYRRRKGTLPLLEQLAHDVAGWQAHAVELFNRVAVTPHLDHPRPHLGVAADLCALHDHDVIGSAFDPLAYTPDIRLMSGTRRAPGLDAGRPMSRPGRRLAGVGQVRPNLPNIGLFIWRMQPALREGVAYPHPEGGGRYWFDGNGKDVQLYNRPVARDYSRVAREHELPVALRRSALAAETKALRQAQHDGHMAPQGFFNPVPPFAIKGITLDTKTLLITDLTSWEKDGLVERLRQEHIHADETRSSDDFHFTIAIDPTVGRFVLLDDQSVSDMGISYYTCPEKVDDQQHYAERESALLAQLEEYLRFGLELGLIYVT